VTLRFDAADGSLSAICCSTSPTVDNAETGSERVAGNPRPGNVVSRTLIVGAMLALGNWNTEEALRAVGTNFSGEGEEADGYVGNDVVK